MVFAHSLFIIPLLLHKLFFSSISILCNNLKPQLGWLQEDLQIKLMILDIGRPNHIHYEEKESCRTTHNIE